MIINVAMMQMKVEYDKTEDNLQRMEEQMKQLEGKKVNFVVFPEACDIGWANSLAKDKATTIPGEVSDYYAFLAKKYNVYLAAGVTELDKDEVYNSAVLIDPDGNILLKHRKINLVEGVEDDIYTKGNMLSVCMTPFGRIGLNICADNLEQESLQGRMLGQMGACMILSPSSWAVPPTYDNCVTPYGGEWENAYKKIAQYCKIPVVGVSNTGVVISGPWKDWKVIGSSIAVDKEGNVLAKMPYGENENTIQIIKVNL